MSACSCNRAWATWEHADTNVSAPPDPQQLAKAPKIFLAGFPTRCRISLFFETDGPWVHLDHRQMSGNPVKIGDGCATVTGYKLPQPLVSQEAGKAGARFQARSQDIGLAVLVMVVRIDWPLACPSRRPTSPSKRRMGPARRVSARWDALNAFILRFAGA